MANKAKLTAEEARRRRNEASRRWYQAHKAQNPRKTKPADKPKHARNDSATADATKQVDKLVKKNVKTVSSAKELVKSAASVLTDVYKTKNQKFIDSTVRKLSKDLSLTVESVEQDQAGKPRKVVSLDVGSKAFRIPAGMSEQTVDAEEVLTETEPVEAEPVEIPVDPDKLDEVASGSDDIADVDTGLNEEPIDDDDTVDEENDEEEDEDLEDDEDLDPEERSERRRRRQEREDEDFEEDYLTGRAEMMQEMGEMGFGEEN